MPDIENIDERLGIGHSISFLVSEFFDKYLFNDKSKIHKKIDVDGTIYDYARNVTEYAKSAHTETFSIYMYKIIELLHGSKNDYDEAVDIFSNTLAEHYLNRWYKEIKTY